MKTSLFDYNLPPKLIAQKPARPRDSSRLMVLDRSSGDIGHRVFRDVIEYLNPADVLVMNDTKVFKARLRGKIEGRAAKIEIFLIHPEDGKAWQVLARPARKLSPGSQIIFGSALRAKVLEKKVDGTALVQFNRTPYEVIKIANRIGEIPIPPYIGHTPKKFDDYQTVYARQTGSVAAPTAGFHFTPKLLDQIRKKGVKIKFVTLHVGLGTFKPIKSDTLETHDIHKEWAQVPTETIKTIANAKKEGQRVIAVGTTTVRALEGLLGQPDESKKEGWVQIFITPGYEFKIIDGLITNFHLPKSTLLALVSAFAGRQKILKAYETAIRKKYRFYSFGDAMLIK